MIRITNTPADTTYTDPYIQKLGIVNFKIDVSSLTAAEVDTDGNLKPNVPFADDGTLVGVGEKVYGLSVEAEKIADNNTGLGAITNDPIIAVTTIATINRDIAEDNLGRAFTANELAGFALAGANFTLTTT